MRTSKLEEVLVEDKPSNIKRLMVFDSMKEVKTTDKTVFKRSYTLKKTTIRKLQELKLLHFPLNKTYNDIVDLAIRELYQSKINNENISKQD